jgi:hypothetical protein
MFTAGYFAVVRCQSADVKANSRETLPMRAFGELLS